MTLVARLNAAFTAIAADIKALIGRVVLLESGGPLGSSGSITTTISGDITMPYIGVARRYSAFNRTFRAITVGVPIAPTSTVTVTIRKNEIVVASIELLAGQTYVTGTINFSMVPGDYLTTDMSGGSVSDIVISLD